MKTVSKDKSSDSASKNTSDCGKFPSSGEHPAGANHPVVPAVAQVKSRMMNATSQNSSASNETGSGNSSTESNVTV